MEKRLLPYVLQQKCFAKAGVLLLGALLLALPAKVIAQADTSKKLKEVNINNQPVPQVQTITPAQRVTSADFTRYSALTVADAIRDFAGVNIKDYGGIGGLKTVSVRSLGADNTAVLYNGIQLSDTQNGQIDLSKFNLNNIQEIALYNAQPTDILQTARAFASASVLFIKTIVPVFDPLKPYKIVAGVKGGSFGLVNPYLQWQQHLNKQWAFIINSSLQKANGRYKFKVDNDGSDTLATRKNTDIDTRQIDGGLYWAKNDSSKFNLQVNYYKSDRGLPGAVIPYIVSANQYLHNQDLFIQSGYEHTAANSFQVKVSSKYSSSYLNYFDSQILNSQGFVDERYTQHEFYQSAAVSYKPLPNWQLSYASDAAVSNLFSDVFKYAFPTRLSLYNVLATSFAYGKWQFQGNLLHTYINDAVKTGTAASSKNALTPTAIASVRPFQNQSFQLRAYYKSTFRNPTFSEQYYYAILPRTLKPEYTNQYNIGASYAKSLTGVVDYVSLTADVYYNHVKDKIIFIPTRSPDVPSVINLGKVDIKGLDVNFKSRYSLFGNCKGLLSASYTYQDAIDVTNPTDSYYLDQIPYTPKHTLALNAGITHKQLGVYYNQILASSRYYTNNNTPDYYMPGYSVSDASVVYTFLGKRYPVTASAEASNIFNKNYSIVNNFPMPGRSVRFTIQISI